MIRIQDPVTNIDNFCALHFHFACFRFEVGGAFSFVWHSDPTLYQQKPLSHQTSAANCHKKNDEKGSYKYRRDR